LKPSWGIGTLVAILLSVALYLLQVFDLRAMVSVILLLCGLWTILTGFMLVERKDRSYYTGWGVVVAALSLFYVTPSLNYTIALVLLAIVALIIINVYIGKTPRIYTAEANPPAPAGDTPAAT
jgi:hypothetical protein